MPPPFCIPLRSSRRLASRPGENPHSRERERREEALTDRIDEGLHPAIENGLEELREIAERAINLADHERALELLESTRWTPTVKRLRGYLFEGVLDRPPEFVNVLDVARKIASGEVDPDADDPNTNIGESLPYLDLLRIYGDSSINPDTEEASRIRIGQWRAPRKPTHARKYVDPSKPDADCVVCAGDGIVCPLRSANWRLCPNAR